jgi:hypothetical protein
MDHLAFSPAYLYEMAWMLRENIGAIFSVALHTFLVVLGVYVVLNIIGNIGQ